MRNRPPRPPNSGQKQPAASTTTTPNFIPHAPNQGIQIRAPPPPAANTGLGADGMSVNGIGKARLSGGNGMVPGPSGGKSIDGYGVDLAGSGPGSAMSTTGAIGTENNLRLCRNVLIYGSCRFEDKGCIYSHTPPNRRPAGSGSSSKFVPQQQHQQQQAQTSRDVPPHLLTSTSQLGPGMTSPTRQSQTQSQTPITSPSASSSTSASRTTSSARTRPSAPLIFSPQTQQPAPPIFTPAPANGNGNVSSTPQILAPQPQPHQGSRTTLTGPAAGSTAALSNGIGKTFTPSRQLGAGVGDGSTAPSSPAAGDIMALPGSGQGTGTLTPSSAWKAGGSFYPSSSVSGLGLGGEDGAEGQAGLGVTGGSAPGLGGGLLGGLSQGQAAFSTGAKAFVPRSAPPSVSGGPEYFLSGEDQSIATGGQRGAEGSSYGRSPGEVGLEHDIQHMTVHGKEMFQPMEPRSLDHHLYTNPLPHTSNLPASHLPLHNFFLPSDLLEFVHSRAEAKLAISMQDANLPEELHVYHSLHTLQSEGSMGERSPRVFGFLSDVYRAKCTLDGRLYCLRRIEGFKLAKEAAFIALDHWRRIRHPNIVSVREAFTTRLFNDSSVVFAYDYHPCARTLYEAHLIPSPNTLSQPHSATGIMTVPERLLWSYIAQIANGLKAVHTAGLACRTVEPTKIILTGRNRLRLNCCSIFDVIAYDNGGNNVHFQQQEDLINFGRLLVSLCLGTTSAVHNLTQSLDTIHATYSPDVKLIVLYLLGKPGPTKCIDDVLVMLGPRLLNEFDAMQNYADVLESGLEAEVENGRVARLLTKLGFINERPEFQQDPRWSETGDRYVLKLFRDYVFHSVDESGAPVLDLTHVLACLNKTDAGLDERLLLIARDDQSCLVVSYREIKNCIETAYNELLQASKGRR